MDHEILHRQGPSPGISSKRSTTPSPPPKPSTILISWLPPSLNFLKLKFDGSVKNQDAAAGFIMMNHMKEGIFAESFNLDSTLVFVAKATALHCGGIISALNLNLTNLMIEGDNLLIMNAIKGTWNAPW